MAEVITRSSITLEGVWQLEEKALLELDALLEEHWGRMQQKKKDEIERAARKVIEGRKECSSYSSLPEEEKKKANKEIRAEVASRYKYSNDVREFVFEFDSGKVVRYVSFAEALKDASVKDELPKQVTAKLEVRFERFSVQVPFFQGTSVYLHVYPDDSAHARDFMAQVEHWAIQNRLRPLLCRWNSFSPFFSVLFMAVLALGGIAFLTQSYSSSGRWKTQEQAAELLREGIKTREDERRAIELTLTLASGNYPVHEARPLSPVWLVPLFAALVSCIALSFPPRTIIGVGKGKEQIERSKWWVWLVGYFVPMTILTGVLIPFAREYFKTLL